MKNIKPPASPTAFKTAPELVAEPLVTIYQGWRELAGGRFAPRRREVDPARFKAHLDSVFLVEVVGESVDFRLGLAGDRVMRFLGSEFKVGKLLSEIATSPFQERSVLLFRRCVGTRAPVALGPVRTLHDDRDFLDIETIILPLSDDGVSVTGLLGGVHLTPALDVGRKPATP